MDVLVHVKTGANEGQHTILAHRPCPPPLPSLDKEGAALGRRVI